MGATGRSRRRAQYEMDDAAIVEAARYARSAGKILRVAFNTLPASSEVPLFLARTDALYAAGVRDFILTDPGLMMALKNRHPDTILHASVGCTIINVQDPSTEEAGASQVVAECRMGKATMRRIKAEAGVGLEVLVHATTCYTLLGRCTMSSTRSTGTGWMNREGPLSRQPEPRRPLLPDRSFRLGPGGRGRGRSRRPAWSCRTGPTSPTTFPT